MPSLKSLLYMLPRLWETLCERVSTVAYPFGPPEIPPNFRGRVRIEADLCHGCGACVRDCPSFGLELEKEGRDEFRLIYYPRRCIFCGQCEESCRFDAIRLTNEFVEPSVGRRPSREVLVHRQPDEEPDDEVDETTGAPE
jgi:formate hydrogenlyase subunit 6/NADH:ubiquinone oxidoreductase subunit I